MDYFNFNIEFEGISEYTKNNTLIISDFASLIQIYHKYQDLLVTNCQRSVAHIFSTSEFDKTSLSLRLLEFYNSFNHHIINLQQINSKIESEILRPLNEFISHLKSQNSLVFSEFSDLIKEIYNQKNKYENIRTNYFNSAKEAIEQENEVVKIMNNKNSTENEIKSSNDKLVKLRAISEEKCEVFKIEVKNTNDLYEKSNKKYFPVFNKIKDIEESKSNFLKFYFEKLNFFLQQKKLSFDNFINSQIQSNEIVPSNDTKIFEDKFNFIINKNERIPKEEFLNYDLYRRNIESLIKQNEKLLKNDYKNNLYPSNENFISTFKKSTFVFNNDENQIIDGIFLKKNIDKFKFENLNKKMVFPQYCKDFVDKILEIYKKTIKVPLKNEDNFYKLGTLLSNVINNIQIQKDLFEINFAIAYVSEKTFFQSEENPFYKIYLCKVLSEKNKNLKTKKFWHKLIQLKIETAIQIKIQNYIEKENKKLEEKLKRKEKTNATSNKINFANMFKNMIGNNNSNQNIINIINSPENIKNNQKKSEKFYKNNKKSIAINVLKDFIIHFSCFNLDSSDVFDIISEISNEYEFSDEQTMIKLIISMINSNMYSIKNTKFNFQKNDFNLLKKGKKLDNYFISKNYIKNTKDNKIQFILNSLKYLNCKDFINLMCLNKNFNNIISKILFKFILFTNDENLLKKYLISPINLQKHLLIWKKILHSNIKIKNPEKFPNFSFEDLKKKFPEENKNNRFELIRLDVMRMSFATNQKEKREQIENILRCLSIQHPETDYCQGMNYIASFLLHFTNDEKESFEIFNKILIYTDYADLYTNELHRLNKYFYVFDRIIYLFLPEVYIHLKNKAISVRYYISPWFITLFTSSFQHITERENPLILVFIFDVFILEGWKGVIKVGLCLMKHFESKIMNLGLESLLHFLINDILKFDFFQNQNFEKLKNMYDSIKIDSALIENLDYEFEINEKLNKEKEEKEKKKEIKNEIKNEEKNEEKKDEIKKDEKNEEKK